MVGVDTAKRVFQLHWVEPSGELIDLKLSRKKFLEHFANRAPCRIGMEACGGSQDWARRFREMGHEVCVLPAKSVRPFVGGNKSDVQGEVRRHIRPRQTIYTNDNPMYRGVA